jgi:DNA-binding NtrC family response regulator
VLAECSVLLVEDNVLIGLDLARVLMRARCTVVGPHTNVVDALAEIQRTPIDAAVVDVNLGNDKSFALMDALSAARIPFIIVTGYERESLPERFEGVLVVNKPFRYEGVRDEIRRMLGPISRNKRTSTARGQQRRQQVTVASASSKVRRGDGTGPTPDRSGQFWHRAW